MATKSAVFFGAHPDDAELFAAGTLLRLRDFGWDISWVIATDGSAAAGAPDQALAATRKLEAQAAADYCGARMVWLGFPDGCLSVSTEAPQAMANTMRDLSPDLILTHHAHDYHNDHRAISRYVTQACPPDAQLIYSEPMLGIGPHPDLIIDITQAFETKTTALGFHVSQSPEIMVSALNTWNSFRAMQLIKRSVKKAEGFMISGRTASQADPMRILPNGLTMRRYQAPL